MRMRALLGLAFLCSALAADHNSLLPRPRQIRYGAGRLAIRGLRIRLASAPSPEDRFTARELSAWLEQRSGAAVPIGEGTASSRAIVLRRTGAVDALPVPGERVGEDAREAYSLRITPGGAEINARSSAGVYYAAQTLRQMVEGDAQQAALPEAEVRDWPALAYRGYMMDMSHTQLPTVADIKRQLDFLAIWKTNQYYFYSEASIELDGFPNLMPEARYTQAQVKEIIDYARERHIDVVPNLELYGHLHDLFRLERYADLSVIPHGGEFNRADPRIGPLLADWVGQVARLFPSSFFHIGGDETWLLSKEAAKRNMPPEDLYLGHIREVVAMVEKAGKRPLAWADMMQKYPQMVPKLPRGLIAVPWHYFPMSDAEYERLLSPFSRSGMPNIVQAAVINWNWLAPDFETGFRNVDTLLAAGRKHSTLGLIQSGWTDDTQNLTRMARPAWAYSSVAAWQTEALDHSRFLVDYAAALYPPATAGEVAKALEALARAEGLLQKATTNSTISAFWANPLAPEELARSRQQAGALRETRLAAEESQAHLLRAIQAGVDVPTLQSMLVGARMIDFAALKHIYGVEIADFWNELRANPDSRDARDVVQFEVTPKYHSRTSDMMDGVAEIRDRFREAWLTEFTPFRLSVAMGKFDTEFQAWWKLQRRMLSATKQAKQGLPALDTLTSGLW